MLMQGLVLGLSTGVTCITYCAPALIPNMMKQGSSTGENYIQLLKFLAGRLIGYLAFGMGAWAVSRLWTGAFTYGKLLTGLIYVVLAVALGLTAFIKVKSICAVHTLKGRILNFMGGGHKIYSLVIGLITGLNLCPPFLLALTQSVQAGSLINSLLFFLAFFIGTSVYLLPFPLIGIWKGNEIMKLIGRMSAGIAAIYFFYVGVIYILLWISNK